MTLPRTSRADRRREGLLPAGEDPMVRRPPARPAGGPPPGAGRRRTDADPTAAPGRPPATGERRRPQPVPSAAAPVPARPLPAASGPMTAASAGRVVPPAARRDDAPRPGHGATAFDAPPRTGPDVTPPTGTMPTWAAEPGPPVPPPDDVTQRVSGAAPVESPWGAGAPRAAAPGRVRLAPVPAVRAEPVTEATPLPEPEPAREPVRKRVNIPVGGRAAARLERQAAEAARKKSGRRTPGESDGPGPSGPGRQPARSAGREVEPGAGRRRMPARLVQGAVAVVVVAVGVLGFWSFTSPQARETAAQTPLAGSAPATSSAAEPAQQSGAPPAEVAAPAPAGPVRAPITVLNSTSINGLAAAIGNKFSTGGWEVASTGKSPVSDVATTTVYFTEGDTVQQQAAAQLVAQFPDVSGPVPRYFQLADQPTPGLVVVATGNWRP